MSIGKQINKIVKQAAANSYPLSAEVKNKYLKDIYNPMNYRLKGSKLDLFVGLKHPMDLLKGDNN